ncbi:MULTISPECIES: hypothetical protein [unclassified Streptomyces]|uniref:hypothetical protein n=1 Tax=unclassified Streptomyces TaxID=2593676 RepID=UPI002E2E857E|nr:hypothetical protein [Streptomyces sp. NBC_00223]
MKTVRFGCGCFSVGVGVVLVVVVAVVGISRVVGSSHQHTARKHVDQRARSYADALGESYARGETGADELKALARSAGGGRLGMVEVTTRGDDTVVNFEGDERYSTPGNPYGSSVLVCYRVTLGPSTPSPVPLATVRC